MLLRTVAMVCRTFSIRLFRREGVRGEVRGDGLGLLQLIVQLRLLALVLVELGLLGGEASSGGIDPAAQTPDLLVQEEELPKFFLDGQMHTPRRQVWGINAIISTRSRRMRTRCALGQRVANGHRRGRRCPCVSGEYRPACSAMASSGACPGTGRRRPVDPAVGVLYTPGPEWGCSSVGRAFVWHTKGRRFDPCQLHWRESAAPAARRRVFLCPLLPPWVDRQERQRVLSYLGENPSGPPRKARVAYEFYLPVDSGFVVFDVW